MQAWLPMANGDNSAIFLNDRANHRTTEAHLMDCLLH